VATFLPPAIGRLPFTFVHDHPVPFLLIPSGLAVGGLAYDTWRRRRVDRLLLTAAMVFVASFPARIAFIGTPAWASASAWLATLVD